MNRFYLENQSFELNKPLVVESVTEIHHLKNVLRLKTGDTVVVFNNHQEEAVCEIENVSTQRIELLVVEVKVKENLKLPQITLACAVPKKSKFEWIIEKCTELGVDEIYPMKTKRTEVVFSEDKRDAKLKRFQTVAINAAKQCQRTDIPNIHPMIPIEEILKNKSSSTLKLIPCLIENRQSIFKVLENHPQSAHVQILIGPEGDFTDEEVKLAISSGYIPVSLGDTTLKVETAAIVAVSCVRLFYQ